MNMSLNIAKNLVQIWEMNHIKNRKTKSKSKNSGKRFKTRTGFKNKIKYNCLC